MRIIGTITLFYGCVALIAEARMALRSVKDEMQFTLALNKKYREQRPLAPAEKTESAGSGA